ncbi:MAG TPA: ABC transporter substrate-binding protein [candidate division Zixibacteria bacterium]|nr:ABC transporter substrate-binding protein [candidate division Zixibacteria bacterium]
MKRILLTLACEDYDRTRPLREGAVKPEGIDLNYLVMPVEEIFWRMMKYEEFDASELSLGALLIAAGRGRRPFVAIPVFPSRTFRHRCIFVNAERGITRPEDLRGKRVGVPEYSMTAAVWLRGLLQHEYGVAPEEIFWVQAGEEHPGRKDRVDFELPPRIRIESIPDRTLNDMIETGEIDAMMSPRMPSCFVAGSPKVRRLFPDYKRAEMDYYRRTGLFPLMHVVVVRRAVYEAFPWVAQALYKAFCEAKDRCMRELYDTNVLRVSLPWTAAEYEEIRDLMGEDYWPYGLEPNRRNLETLNGYLHEQGLVAAPLVLDELFARETLEAFKI